MNKIFARVRSSFILPNSSFRFGLAMLAAIFCAAIARAEEPTPKPVILMTGFEPFGGSSFNTSWDVVSTFDGQVISGHVIKTVRLKVVYDKIDGPLAEAIEKLKPVAVISFGEGTPEIHVEKIARNSYHPAKPPDNEGKAPPRDAIVPGGAQTIRSGLPADAIVQKLNDAGIKAATSDDAGGYLCNECFYRLMAVKNAPAIRGFVHVPVVPPDKEEARKQLDDAVRIILKTVAENK